EPVLEAPAAAAGDHAEAGIENAAHRAAVVEALVEIAGRPHLLADPALVDLLIEAQEPRRVDAAFLERLEDRLGGHHAAFHRQVHAFELLAVEEAAAVPDHQEA